MTSARKIWPWFALLMLLFAPLARAEALNYGGRLVDPSGKPLVGETDFRVRFFDGTGPGNPLGTAVDVPDVPLTDGVFQFTIELDAANALAIFASAPNVYIELEDLTRNTKLARQRFGIVPYAYQSTTTKSLNLIPLETGTPGNGDVLKYSTASQAWKFEPDAGASGSGEVNTGLSLGGDADVFKIKDLTELQFRGLTGGAGVTVTERTNDVKIDVSLTAADIAETGTRKWLSDTEQAKLAGITAGANMLKATYDPGNDGKADGANLADDSTLLGGNNAAYYRNAGNINAGQIGDSYIPAAIARDAELPTAASIAAGFASDAISGDKVDGGTISNFASTGIDDNADALAMTISAAEFVGIGSTSPVVALDVRGSVGLGLATNRIVNGAMHAGERGVEIAYGLDAADKVTIQGHHQGSAFRDLLLEPRGGNVGVGTTSPAAPLHIVGQASNEVARFVGRVDASNNRNYLSLYTTNPAYWWELSNQDAAGGGTTNGLSFRERSNAAAVDRLYLASGGNVGIGSMTPQQRLDVVSSTNNSFDGVVVRPANLSQALSIGWLGLSSTYSLQLNSATGFPTVFLNNGVEQVRVNNDGRVGIGSNAPGAKLDIAGVAGTDGIKFPDGTIATSALPKFHGAKIYKATGTQSLPNLTFAAIAMDGENFDSNAFHDTAVQNTRITIPAGLGGYYSITGCVAFDYHTAGIRIVAVAQNGSTVAENRSGPASDATGASTPCVATTTILAAGDYVELLAYQSSGAALNAAPSAMTQLTVTFVGK